MMKKLYFILLFILISFIFKSKLLAQCSYCNNLTLNLPQSFGRVNGGLEEAVYVVKPTGLYTQYDVYLTYSSYNPYYNSPLDSFEIVHNFTLPKEAAIVDSWLWVDDFIMKAQILERNAAFNIYEGIVNRRKDPSILYKNSSTSYEFRIFPLPNGKTRKVKLSILIPNFINGNNIESTIPFSLIQSSNLPIQPRVICYKKDVSDSPSLSTNNAFAQHSSSQFGSYSEATLTTLQYMYDNVKISFNTNKNQGHAFYAFEKDSTGGQGYFQLQMDPSYIIKDLNFGGKKLALFIDHNSSNTPITKNEVINSVKRFISKLSSNDQIKVYYSKLDIKQVSDQWVKVGDINIDEYMKKIDLGNSSLLISGLNKMYSDLEFDKDADVVIFSSDASITSASESQQLKDDLVDKFGKLNRTFIVYYKNPSLNGNSIYYENVFYSSDELFNKILSSNTKGLAVSLIGNFAIYTFDEASDLIYNAIQGISYDYFQYYIKPQNGLCYDVYSYRTGNKTTYFGRYKGQSPFTLEYTFLIKDSIITNSIVFNDVAPSHDIDFIRQTHIAQKLRSLEEENQYSNRQYITDLSIENRVLSLYTAFLALDPNLQEPCFDCENEVTVGVIDGNQEVVQITSYPNPFVDKVAIKITNTSVEDIKELKLFDIAGQSIKIDFNLIQNEKDIEISIDGSQLQKGLYILRFLYKGKIYTIKVVKA